jgi:SNF2 family DNA or RNA helicase
MMLMLALSPYQEEGARFLAERGRCILADEMGLGKTAMAIRAALLVGARDVLVVTKKSLIFNWRREIAAWGQDARTRWDVTNYEQVVLRPQRYTGVRYDTLVVDEAAAIRNRKSKRSKAVRMLARRIPRVWLLTGTPIVNGPWDLWPLLNAVDPKGYSSFWAFVDRHIVTSHNGWGVQLLGVKDERAFLEEISPVVLRRTKELLGLPPLSYEEVYVPLCPVQGRIYRDLRQDFLAVVAPGRLVVTPSVVALITRLRQVCCSPALIGGPDESSKTEAVMDLLEDVLPTGKALVFSAFAEYVKLLAARFSDAGWEPAVITGDASEAERVHAVERFNGDRACRVLVGTIKAMGVGLNLQAASTVIFADREWTPAANEQAVGRAYRRGQTGPVHVASLIAPGTVEDFVRRKLEEKASHAAVLEEALRGELEAISTGGR